MLIMGFFDEAVKVLETIVEAMQGRHSNYYPPPIPGCRDIAVKCPEFTKRMVRVKKHIRPPVRAGPEIWSKPPGKSRAIRLWVAEMDTDN